VYFIRLLCIIIAIALHYILTIFLKIFFRCFLISAFRADKRVQKECHLVKNVSNY